MGSRPRGSATPGSDAAAVLNSVRRLVRAIRAVAQEAEDTLGISGAQHFVLECLDRTPGLSLTDLAAQTWTDKSSVSVVVSRLVERGFVSRRPSTADRRSIVLALTADGRRALRRLPDSAQARMIAALRRMHEHDVALFAQLFVSFTTELGVQDLPPMMLLENDASVPRRNSKKARTV